MKTAKLIKFQEKAERRSMAEQRPATTTSQETVRNWLSEYQQQKPANPRAQFAQLFKLAA